MADQRPNIILIITDQQRYDTIRALGFPYVDTPALDRLVDEGVAFTNAFVTAPSCAPSRASLFTGYYPHTTGILKNADRWRHAWVEWLAASGYYCVNVGKMHTFPYETPLGFHERYVVENKDRYLEGRYYFDEWDRGLRARGLVKQQRELYRQRPDYRERLGAFEWELPEETHSDMFVGDMAAWWIDHKPRPDGPLFLQIGFPGPHPPYDPIPRYAEPYMARDLPLPGVTEEELADQPPPFLAMRQHNAEVDHDSIAFLLHPTREQLHRQRAYYLANVTMIDEKVARILQALEHRGYLENAVVVFTSDHGDCLGDHGHSQKWTMYDVIVRVPLIVWSPGRFAGGRKLHALCQQMDVGPALLDLAGVPIPATMEAESLLPALQGERKLNAEPQRRPRGRGLEQGGQQDLLRSRPPSPGADLLRSRPPSSGADLLRSRPPSPGADLLRSKPPSSGAPLLRSKPPSPGAQRRWAGRPYVFAEHGRDGILRETAFMTMVRSQEWKLVHFLDEPFGQLFDLTHDPGEVHNLWDDPAAAEARHHLLDVLREWRIRSAYQTREWAEEWR